MPLNFEALTPCLKPGGCIMEKGLMAATIDQMKEIFLQAERANVNVYLLDVKGLRATNNGENQLELDYLLTVAENTKGKAFINTNDLEPAVKEIFVENNSYLPAWLSPRGAAEST